MLHVAKNRWVKLSTQALIVLALIGGLFYVTTFQKSVALSVDGQQRTVSMFGSTVSDALAAANITVGVEDHVSPALDAPIAEGQSIEVLTEKGVKVSIDGADRVVNTTGLTVEDIIKQLGISPQAQVSLDGNTPLNGLDSTLSITTAGALADAKAAAEKAAADKADAAKKVAAQNAASKNAVSKNETAQADAAKKAAALKAAASQSVAARAEAATKAAADQAAAATKAAEARKAAEAKAAAAKATAVKEAATQKAEAAKKEAAAKAAAQKKAQAASSSSKVTTTANVSGAWAALAKCESGGNWSINSGNGYYGGLQFSLSSWRAVGGTQYAAYPHLATPAQQIAAAEKLRASGGWGHWPACSSKLGLR